MEKKKLKALNDELLEKVSGGFDDPFSDIEAVESSLPFECSCGTFFYICLGATMVKCPNPSCGKKHYLDI